MKLRNLIGAAAVAAALPMAAGAVTVVEGINFGATYDVPGNYSAVVMFNNGDPGGSLTWTFQNTSSDLVAVTVVSATVEQFLQHAFFTGGTTTSLNGDSETTDQGMPEGFFLNTVIAPNGTADLTFLFGDVFEVPGNDVVFDFNIASTAIPLPASVFMLLAGLGGLGIVSRRRKTASA